MARVDRLYAGSAENALEQACGSLPLDLVEVKHTDPVWADRESWVWRRSPVFSNRHVRMFECAAAGAAHQTRRGTSPGANPNPTEPR